MTPQAAWELQYNSATREEKTIFNGLVEAVEEEIRGVSSYYHCFSNSISFSEGFSPRTR
jgi:hypothetical protein